MHRFFKKTFQVTMDIPVQYFIQTLQSSSFKTIAAIHKILPNKLAEGALILFKAIIILRSGSTLECLIKLIQWIKKTVGLLNNYAVQGCFLFIFKSLGKYQIRPFKEKPPSNTFLYCWGNPKMCFWIDSYWAELSLGSTIKVKKLLAMPQWCNMIKLLSRVHHGVISSSFAVDILPTVGSTIALNDSCLVSHHISVTDVMTGASH